MTTAKKHAQTSAHRGLQNGIIGLFFGVILMLTLGSSDKPFMFFAAGLFALGALIYTISSIVAVRRHR